jgi:hypothetical protein
MPFLPSSATRALLSKHMKLNMSKSLVVLDVLGGDSVESSSSLIGDDSGVDLQSVSLLVLADVFLLLQLLKTPSDGLSTNGSVVLRGAVAPLQATVDVGKQTHASVRPQVDLASEGSHLHVDPVVVEGSELVACIGDEVREPLLT